VFVLTRSVPDEPPTGHVRYVTDVRSGVALAREAAGGRDVMMHGAAAAVACIFPTAVDAPAYRDAALAAMRATNNCRRAQLPLRVRLAGAARRMMGSPHLHADLGHPPASRGYVGAERAGRHGELFLCLGAVGQVARDFLAARAGEGSRVRRGETGMSGWPVWRV
jgi:hypothetical protein